MSAPSMKNAVSMMDAVNAACKQVHEESLREDAILERSRVLDQEIAAAWEILCPNGRSVVTKSQLFENMKAMFPHTSAKDIKDLVGPGNMSLEKLQVLLTEADTPIADIEAEAFKFLDPLGTGHVDMATFHKLLLQIPGIDSLDESDKALVSALVDVDKDGRISFEDFKQIGTWEPPKQEVSERLKKLIKEREERENRAKLLAEERGREKEREMQEKQKTGGK